MAKIRAIFFDAGDTMIHQWAPKAERFFWLCRRAGIQLPTDPQSLRAGALAQERFFQNRHLHPMGKSPAWYHQLFVEGLSAMGTAGDRSAQAMGIIRMAQALPITHVLDPEALPLLEALRKQGYRLAIVSNWDGTLLEILRPLGLAGYFDAILDSDVVGSRKPDGKIFEIACAATGVRPGEALHLGDSPGTDVAGAHAAGIRPVLLDALDAFGMADLPEGTLRIRRLSELTGVIEAFLV